MSQTKIKTLFSKITEEGIDRDLSNLVVNQLLVNIFLMIFDNVNGKEEVEIMRGETKLQEIEAFFQRYPELKKDG